MNTIVNHYEKLLSVLDFKKEKDGYSILMDGSIIFDTNDDFEVIINFKDNVFEILGQSAYDKLISTCMEKIRDYSSAHLKKPNYIYFGQYEISILVDYEKHSNLNFIPHNGRLLGLNIIEVKMDSYIAIGE